ncbi:hypothetical protein [Streptomyces sp. NPDC048111]|uniref:hypothetical protein n=1 Tax=Streptomyces sp. NPDC048111 TaxID=3365500 RepID=UPI00370F7FAB
MDGPTSEEKQSWIAVCAVRYCVTFAIGWIVTAAIAPPGQDPHRPDAFVAMSRWASFKDYLSAGPGIFLLIAVPSLIILLIIGHRGQRMQPEEIRVMTGFLLLLPTLFLALGGGVLLLVTAVFQGGFGAVMPGPLAPRED